MSSNGMELARELLRALPPDGRDRLKPELRRYVRDEDKKRLEAMRAVHGDLDELDELEAAVITYQENFGGLDPALVLGGDRGAEARAQGSRGLMTMVGEDARAWAAGVLRRAAARLRAGAVDDQLAADLELVAADPDLADWLRQPRPAD
jgi:hypothetical protein